MLGRASTPSIMESNWLTMVSCTPVPPLLEVPLYLQMASISSKMMTCSLAFSLFCLWSVCAGRKRSLMFFSDSPTNLLIKLGPLTLVRILTDLRLFTVECLGQLSSYQCLSCSGRSIQEYALHVGDTISLSLLLRKSATSKRSSENVRQLVVQTPDAKIFELEFAVEQLSLFLRSAVEV